MDRSRRSDRPQRPAWPARAACVALTLPWLMACARPLDLRPPPAADVEIVDRSTGETLAVYEHRGERWVAGVPGHRYAIRVRNAGPGRVLAVMSVDGLNVLSGETAAWNQRGYVFGPGDTYEVAGWRKSQERIAAFEFSSVPQSYAARTGRPANVGVIGVALFREAAPAAPPMEQSPAAGAARDERSRDEPAPPSEASDASAAPAAPAPLARARTPGLGTAHGRGENSHVDLTSFERAQAAPDRIVSIRYDRYDALVAMGIVPAPARGPDPFPDSAAGYVPDPPGR